MDYFISVSATLKNWSLVLYGMTTQHPNANSIWAKRNDGGGGGMIRQQSVRSSATSSMRSQSFSSSSALLVLLWLIYHFIHLHVSSLVRLSFCSVPNASSP